jgi:hypothetical protein
MWLLLVNPSSKEESSAQSMRDHPGILSSQLSVYPIKSIISVILALRFHPRLMLLIMDTLRHNEGILRSAYGRHAFSSEILFRETAVSASDPFLGTQYERTAETHFSFHCLANILPVSISPSLSGHSRKTPCAALCSPTRKWSDRLRDLYSSSALARNQGAYSKRRYFVANSHRRNS